MRSKGASQRFSGRNQSYPIERSPYQLRRRRRRPYGIVATIVCLVSTVRCCSDIVTHQGETSYCTITENEEKCIYGQTTQLLLQPIGQEACLLLKNKENRIMATVSIRLKQISHICKQKTEYFTRDYEFFTESRHQCYNTESCRGNTCASLKPETKLHDFSMIAKANPGYTYCVPSCGCFWCDWCFHCTSTSLFYRYSTYIIHDIPSLFMPHMEHPSRRNRHAKNRNQEFPFTWNNLRLTFAGTILPNLPILSSYFITDGNIVTRIEPSQQGQLLPNSAGQLQCRTEEEAKSFGSCIFAQYACSCNPRKYAVTCSCPNGTTSSFLHNKHNKLPVITGQAALINERQTIKAKTTIDSALTIQISTNELVIAASINNNSCQVHMEELTGCYSCTQGAIANVSCRSSISEETAQIECSDTTRIVRCTPEGEISTVRFHFINSMVNENCTVRCPGGISTVILKGQLAFVNEATFITEMITPRRSFKSSSSGFTFEN
ncbi:hypothetical protein COOONC_13380, partial [Cooperia oncophora]